MGRLLGIKALSTTPTMRAAGGTYAISMRYRSARVGHSRPLDTEPVNQGCVFASLAFELDHPLSPRMAAQPPALWFSALCTSVLTDTSIINKSQCSSGLGKNRYHLTDGLRFAIFYTPRQAAAYVAHRRPYTRTTAVANEVAHHRQGSTPTELNPKTPRHFSTF